MMRRGFTIIELIMVMVIIAILAVIAIPRFESFYEIKLRGTANRLVLDIRYAQRVAISEHESYGLEFDAANERYRVYQVSTDLPARDPLTRSTGTAQWNGGLVLDYNSDSEYGGIDLTSANFNGTDRLRFTSLGVPQDANGTNLSSIGTVSISYEGSSETVNVTPNTGKVTLQ
ncbi:MAG: GspH/FimT family pseudopilin [Candidatus Omnitrophica bacterium]|nr:GspH/FimT family pseudopilin [Candidatus Omnitrophota bacterium]MBU1933096.1 GspH/FimT family pseudopilin [Candidatus Omnitrophota bacterium]